MNINFPTLFQHYIDVLSQYRTEIRQLDIDIDKLKEHKKYLRQNSQTNHISYQSIDFRFKLPKRLRPSHCIPSSVKDVTVTITCKDQVTFLVRNEIGEDPFVKLNTINFEFENDPYFASWHLDRHTDPGCPTSLHPFYHLTFGGLHMEQKAKEEDQKFGHALILRAPRLPHPPMELILSIDYILQHYLDRTQLKLLNDTRYLKIITNLKDKFWKPYYLTMAKIYCRELSVDSTPTPFNEEFVKKLNGIY